MDKHVCLVVISPDFVLDLKKYLLAGISLVVEWLRLHASNAGVQVQVPGLGTGSQHAMCWNQILKEGKRNYPLAIFLAPLSIPFPIPARLVSLEEKTKYGSSVFLSKLSLSLSLLFNSFIYLYVCVWS